MVKTASLYDMFCKTGNYVIYDVIIWVQDGNCKKWLKRILVLVRSTIWTMDTKYSAFVFPIASIITVLVCTFDNITTFVLDMTHHRQDSIWTSYVACVM